MDQAQFELFMKHMTSSNRELLEKLDQTVKALATQKNTSNNTTENTNESTATVIVQSSVMADLSSRIQKFEIDADQGYQFTKWYERHEGVLMKDGVSLDDSSRVRLLLEKLSDDVYEKYKRQILPKKCAEISLTDTVATLKEMFDTKISVHTTRFQCLGLKQKTDEDLITYTGRVNEECEKAALHDLGNEGLKCLLWICGLHSTETSLRAKLLSYLDKKAELEESPKLHDLFKECERIQTLKQTVKLIEGGQPEVNRVHSKFQKSQSASTNTVCYNCGKPNHRSTECRSAKIRCSKCGNEGHMEKFCRNKGNSKNHSKNKTYKKVNMAKVENADSQLEVNAARRYATVSVDGFKVEFQIDSGADVTLINQKVWEEMGKPELKAADVRIKHAGDSEMTIQGYRDCSFVFHNISSTGRYFVTPGKSLLGLDWLDNNKITRKHLDAMVSVNAAHKDDLISQLKSKYESIFEPGLGRCTKEKAKLVLMDNVQPIFRPKRPVPHSVVETVEIELDRLQKMGVIEPINHSMWSAPIVVVRKPGKIRVCADFSTGLNTALKDVEFPLPVIEDIFATLNGGKIFSQIDLSDAYLQVELEENSKELVVINTHRGLYRYTRLPFGIKTAPAIFQSIMSKMCNGLKGVVSYLDDVIVSGATQEEHDRNLMALLDRVVEYGFRLKLEKCTFRQNKINFLGYVVDAEGRSPNPDKIRAIKEMREPCDVSQLRSFLGMVTHYGNFLPGLKEMRGPLDKLLQHNLDWSWGQSEQRAFQKLKDMLSSDLNLTHYDPKIPIVVAADASSYGIGAVISHRYKNGIEKPIAHGSRSLTAAEKNYSQTEKEGLALIYAVKKFHKFLYGRKFLLRTDHKPLLAIFGLKNGVPIHSANRLIRWSLILTAYDFEIEYVKTTEFGQADGISRLMQKSEKSDSDEIVIAAVEQEILATFLDDIRQLPVTAEEIRTETSRDVLLRKVMKFIRSGLWPKDLEEKLKPYANRKDCLSIVQDCIMDGDRVIIPEKLRKVVLSEVHRGHPGIVYMKSLARSFAYWPNMDKECENLVKSCQKCLDCQKSPQKAPLCPWPEPTNVWQRIHIDYAGPVDSLYYLVVVDAKAKWPEIVITKEISATATVKIMERLFTQYGYPETLVSDNGTQFTSELFARMCSENGIKHIRTAPYHPQSNGQAERFVDTLKRGLRKLKGEGVPSQKVLDEFLLSYRTTPKAILDDKTPAEVFLGRKLRTRLTLILPTRKVEDPEAINEAQQKMCAQFDSKNGVKQKSFKPGDAVMIKWFDGTKKWKWQSGEVKNKIGGVQYEVCVNGKIVRRHANQMRKIEHMDNHNEEVDFWEDLFDLNPTTRPATDSGNGLNNINQPTVPAVIVPERRSTRVRKPVVRFDSATNNKGTRSK